jgi:anaerobic selenocysteine-containing dehydrogenase
MLAEVVLPAASAYEKGGTFTNTCGDLQLLKKAGDITGIKSDFEIIVRVAERIGTEVRKLVPFGSGCARTWDRLAVRSRVKPTVIPSGLRRIILRRGSAHLILTPCSTKSSGWYRATNFHG